MRNAVICFRRQVVISGNLWGNIVILHCLMTSPPLNASSRASEGTAGVHHRGVPMAPVQSCSCKVTVVSNQSCSSSLKTQMSEANMLILANTNFPPPPPAITNLLPPPPCPVPRGFAKGWFPKGWFWRMFPGTKTRNEGTCGCSSGTGTKNRNEGTFGCSPVPNTGTSWARTQGYCQRDSGGQGKIEKFRAIFWDSKLL